MRKFFRTMGQPLCVYAGIFIRADKLFCMHAIIQYTSASIGLPNTNLQVLVHAFKYTVDFDFSVHLAPPQM